MVFDYIFSQVHQVANVIEQRIISKPGVSALAAMAKVNRSGGVELRIEVTLVLQFALMIASAAMSAIAGRDYFTDGGNLSDLTSFTIYILMVLFLPLYGPLLLLSAPLYLVGILTCGWRQRARLLTLALVAAALVSVVAWIYQAHWKGMTGVDEPWALLLCAGIVVAPSAVFVPSRR